MDGALIYFFPGSCYKTVIEDQQYGDGKLINLGWGCGVFGLYFAQCVDMSSVLPHNAHTTHTCVHPVLSSMPEAALQQVPEFDGSRRSTDR